MAESKKGALIEFSGNLEGLVIKVKGKVVYFDDADKGEEIKEPGGKGRSELAIASKFASCICKVPALAHLWGRAKFLKPRKISKRSSPLGERYSRKVRVFNKIVSANRLKEITGKHPDESYLITPGSKFSRSPFSGPPYRGKLDMEGVNMDLYYLATNHDFSDTPQKMTPVGIFCVYDPKQGSKTEFEMIPKWYDIKNFTIEVNTKIFFPFGEKEREILKKYRNCIFYPTFVENESSGAKTRWFSSSIVTFSLEGYPETEIEFGDYKPEAAEVKG
jgi:hypothetical protein